MLCCGERNQIQTFVSSCGTRYTPHVHPGAFARLSEVVAMQKKLLGSCWEDPSGAREVSYAVSRAGPVRVHRTVETEPWWTAHRGATPCVLPSESKPSPVDHRNGVDASAGVAVTTSRSACVEGAQSREPKKSARESRDWETRGTARSVRSLPRWLLSCHLQGRGLSVLSVSRSTGDSVLASCCTCCARVRLLRAGIPREEATARLLVGLLRDD